MKVKTKRLGEITIKNALYIKVNAAEAGQSNVKLAAWLDSHPHADNKEDSKLPKEWLKKYDR